jgi:hypothetical protein
VPKGTRSIASGKNLEVWLSTIVLLYHGQNFSLEETGIVHSETKLINVDGKTELCSLIPTQVSGNYLVKLHAQLIAGGKEIGFKSKRFINLRVE